MSQRFTGADALRASAPHSISRRTLLAGFAAAACLRGASPGAAPGFYLQETAGRDLRTALRDAAAAGYREVELAGWRGMRPADTKKLLNEAGLKCQSVHWTLWENDADSQATIDAAVELGVDYLVTPLPSLMGKEWFEANETAAGARAVAEGMTLNDWRWNADWFNHVGGLAQKNNIQFAYQNHSFEFRKLGAGIAFEELWRRTEPTRVKFELDCGAAVAGGYDPVEFLRKYGERVAMLHVSEATGVAIGRGGIDWKRVLAAAQSAGVKRYYVAVEAGLMRESLAYLQGLA